MSKAALKSCYLPPTNNTCLKSISILFQMCKMPKSSYILSQTVKFTIVLLHNASLITLLGGIK